MDLITIVTLAICFKVLLCVVILYFFLCSASWLLVILVYLSVSVQVIDSDCKDPSLKGSNDLWCADRCINPYLVIYLVWFLLGIKTCNSLVNSPKCNNDADDSLDLQACCDGCRNFY